MDSIHIVCDCGNENIGIWTTWKDGEMGVILKCDKCGEELQIL